MNEKMFNEALKRLDALGESIKTGGIKIGEEAIRWTMIVNIGNLIISCFFIIFSIWSIKKFINWLFPLTTEKDSSLDQVNLWVFLIFGTVLLSVPAIVSILCFPENLAGVFAPSWQIIRSLVPATRM